MLNARSPVPCPEPGSPSRVKNKVASHAVSGGFRMLMGALITFLVVILILYLINLLPLDGRAKQIARVVVIVLGVISLLKYIAVF
jgi:Na+/melibiose symporter-like transporter